MITHPVNVVLNVFILVLSIFFASLMCEGLLRVFWPQFHYSSTSMSGYHDELGYAPLPGAEGYDRFFEFGRFVWKINSQGFRDNEVDIGAFKILALGDSFTFGAGVNQEDSYPAQLESMLVKSSKARAIDVINAGVPSYNTRTELKYFEILGPIISPDIVLVNIVSNDISANLESFSVEKYKRLVEERATIIVGNNPDSGIVPTPTGLKKYLQENSHLYKLTARGFHNILGNIGLKEGDCYGLYILPEPANVKSAWDETKNLISKFKILAEQFEVPIVLVHIPQNIESFESANILKNCNHEATFKNINKIAESLNIPVISTVDAIKDAGGPKLFFWVDGHLNVKGYEVVAKTVALQLNEMDLIP